MQKHLHFNEQEAENARDWHPWVILGLLAVVITFAIFAY